MLSREISEWREGRKSDHLQSLNEWPQHYIRVANHWSWREEEGITVGQSTYRLPPKNLSVRRFSAFLSASCNFWSTSAVSWGVVAAKNEKRESETWLDIDRREEENDIPMRDVREESSDELWDRDPSGEHYWQGKPELIFDLWPLSFSSHIIKIFINHIRFPDGQSIVFESRNLSFRDLSQIPIGRFIRVDIDNFHSEMESLRWFIVPVECNWILTEYSS